MTNDHILPLDPWVASSLLQKAIRRGDGDLAARAALTLYRQRGTGIWRKFMVIGYEDIGLGDLDLVAHATLLGIDRSTRQRFGADVEIIADLAQRFAAAPKDRSTDYLICTAKQHPDLESERAEVAMLPLAAQVAAALDPGQSLVKRAIAAWYASGVNGGGPQVLCWGTLPRLLHAFDEAGLPHPLSSLVETAARKTKVPISVMLPLLWALLREAGGASGVEPRLLPEAPTWRGIPLYAFDKHTALGKRAIALFARENDAVAAALSDHVADYRARDVAAMAAFYVDAIPLARRLRWSHSDTLEAMGLEVDMIKIGCPKDGIAPIVAAVRANLGHLHEIRARLLARQSPRPIEAG